MAGCVRNLRPDKRWKDWPESDGWTVILGFEGRRMHVQFRMGKGLLGVKPTVFDVLWCICCDTSGFLNANSRFEEWASEYGLDTDSRKAHRTWMNVRSQAERLRKFLGADFDAVVYAEEETLREWLEAGEEKG